MGCAAFTRKGAPLPALLAGLALSLFLSGCATYSDSFSAVQGNLASQKYDAALKDIEKQSRSKTDRVLYLLNRGMVLRMKRDFAGSNQALEAAKTEMDRLYAASVSENAMSFLVNDSTVSYGGEDYEQVLVHLYMALNYLELGQKDEARVEALQVDIKLREIGAKVSGNRYARDAFALYLTGMIYEDLGERSDAMISYRDAYTAYKKYQVSYGTSMPDELKQDLLRMAVQLGLRDEAAQYSKEFSIPLASLKDAPPKDNTGELVFIFNNGLAPIKREKRSTMIAPPPSVFTGSAPATPGVYVTIALPFYESQPNNVASARVSALAQQASTERVENIDAIARASLDSHMGAITARSIARAVIKAKLQESVDRAAQNRNNNDSGAALLSSIFVRVAAVATERADTRSWLTLPAEIQLAHLPLPPGTYTIKVELLDAGGQTVTTRNYPGIVITGAHKTYLTEHWTPPAMPSTARR